MSTVLMDEETERRLLANDPSLTLLSWDDPGIVATMADCERAALALCQSTHVDTLSLSLHIFDPFVARVLNGEIAGGLSDTVVGNIAQWMQSSRSLKFLSLSTTGHSQQSSLRVLPHFLSSIRMRSDQSGVDPIAALFLINVHIKADDLVVLIQDGRLKFFDMSSCAILQSSFSTEQEAIHQVAQSFASNSSITSLSLDVNNSNQAHLIGILTALKTNKSIQTLDLRKNTATDQLPIPALDTLLDYYCAGVCPMMKAAVFDSFKWKGEIMTRIAQALMASLMPLKELHIRGGSIDASSCAILQAMFESGGAVDCFDLDGYVKFPKHDNYHAVRDLIGTSRGLKTVRARSFDTQARGQIKQFQAIMWGFMSASCTVEKVEIRKLSLRHLQSLTDTLPYLHSVKAMTIGGLTGGTNGATIKRKLMTGFRRNRSVVESIILWNVLDESDRARLQTYHERNTHLGRLLRLVSGDERSWDENGGAMLPSLLGASVSSGSPVQCLRDILGSLVAAKDLSGAAPKVTTNKRQAVESPGRSSTKRCKV